VIYGKSASLLTFVLGYAAVLAVPGPNMLALGGLAALRGFRAAVPISLGIAIGATALAACISAASIATAAPPWRTAAAFVGAALLLGVAAFVMRLRPDAPAPQRRRAPIAEFGAGFCTAVTNPITSGYFAAEFGSSLQDCAIAALAAIPVVALVMCLSLSRVLTALWARRIVRAWHRPIRLGTAAVLVAMAGLMVLRP
jgi:threonine/homoserine/homoserine lactone efflux protein